MLGLYYPFDACLFNRATALGAFSLRYIPFLSASVITPLAIAVMCVCVCVCMHVSKTSPPSTLAQHPSHTQWLDTEFIEHLSTPESKSHLKKIHNVLLQNTCMQLLCYYKCEYHSTTESVIVELRFTAGLVEGTDWVCPLAST